MIKTSAEFENLWSMRMKAPEDIKRIGSWMIYDDIVRSGVSPQSILEAYRRYKDSMDGREQFAKRMMPWLEEMNDNGCFSEKSDGKYSKGISYTTGQDGKPVLESISRFNPVLKRWMPLPEDEQRRIYALMV